MAATWVAVLVLAALADGVNIKPPARHVAPPKMDASFFKSDQPSMCPEGCNGRGKCLVDFSTTKKYGQRTGYGFKCHCHALWTGSACQTPVDQLLRWFESRGRAPFPNCCNVCPSQFRNPNSYRGLPVYQNPYSITNCDPSLSIDSRPESLDRPPCWRPLLKEPYAVDPRREARLEEIARQAMDEQAAEGGKAGGKGAEAKGAGGEGEGGFIEEEAEAMSELRDGAKAKPIARPKGKGGKKGQAAARQGKVMAFAKSLQGATAKRDAAEHKARMAVPVGECCVYCDFDFWTQENARPSRPFPNAIGVNFLKSMERQLMMSRMGGRDVIREMKRREFVRAQQADAFKSYAWRTMGLLANFLEVDASLEEDAIAIIAERGGWSNKAQPASSVPEVNMPKPTESVQDVIEDNKARTERQRRIEETAEEKQTRITSRDGERAEKRAVNLAVKRGRGMGANPLDGSLAGPQACCTVCPRPAQLPDFPKKEPVKPGATPSPAEVKRAVSKSLKQKDAASAAAQQKIAESLGELRKRDDEWLKTVWTNLRAGRQAGACCRSCPSQFFLRITSTDAGPFDGEGVTPKKAAVSAKPPKSPDAPVGEGGGDDEES